MSKKTEIVALLKAGVAVDSIVTMVPAARTYVVQIGFECGFPIARPKQKLSQQDRTEINDLIRWGMKQMAIADEYGISRSLVSRYARRMAVGVQRLGTQGHSTSGAPSEARGAATS